MDTVKLIADVIANIGIPFACFGAMYYLCYTLIEGVKESVNELKEMVSAQNELIREVLGNAISAKANG